MGQLDKSNDEADSVQPISRELSFMNELGKWLEEMFNYINENRQIITSGFLSSGIAHVLDGQDQDLEISLSLSTSDFSDSDEFEDTEALAVKNESELTKYLLIYCFNNNNH